MSRDKSMDALKGLAIVLVVAGHAIPARSLGSICAGESFSTAFSLGFLNRLDDPDVRRLVAEQLRVAKRAVFSVPSDRHPRAPFAEGRYLAPAQWERILAPVGSVSARYYGVNPLPLRQALVAKMKGSLYQDRLHVMVTVTAAG